VTQAQKRWTLVAVILGSGIVFLDTSVVNLALKAIGKELPRSFVSSAFEGQSYVYGFYFVTLSALLILAGAITDFFGRRKLFAIGLVGFLVTSVMCGLAWNMEALIAFRILQGAAGAFVVPGSLAIITASFEGEEQGRAYGIWAGASAATAILGPFIGGVLVNSISWRAAFFVNVPFLLVALWATVRHVPESRDENSAGHFDWIGSLVVVVAVGGLAFGAIRGEQTRWSGPEAIIALIVGGLALIALPVLMLKRPNPLVPPSLFKSRNFTVTNLSTFVIYGALYVSFTFQGLFMIGTLGYNEPAAGIAGIPSALLLTLLSTRFGRLAARHGPRLFMTVGPALMGLGLLWLVRLPATSAPWVFGTGAGKTLLPPSDYLVDFLPALLVFGAGLSVMVAPLTTAVMTSIPKQNAGVGSAINNAISRVGAPLVTAVIFIAIVSSFYAAIGEKVPEVDTNSSKFREAVAPLNPPDFAKLKLPQPVEAKVADADKEASTGALHVAVLVGSGLLFLGAAINGFGIRNPKPEQLEAAAEAAPAAE
jgi:EmrB/QacA subfamily drug resistance transporter